MSQAEITTSIIAGVVAGIISSLAILMVTKFFNKVLLPWYRQAIYTGIQIGGEWHSVISPFQQGIKLQIGQKA